MSVAQAAASGTHRDLLVAIRARIATAVDDDATPARDLAALTRRLGDVAREIQAVDEREEQESRPVEDEPFDPAGIATVRSEVGR